MLPGFLCLGLAVSSDADALEHYPGIWTTFSTTGAFRDDGTDTRWHYWLDAQARYFDIGSGINQWLVRPAIGYRLSNGVRVWLGYARFRTRGRSGAVADEDRVFQQVDWSVRDWMDGTLSFRGRLLQRSVNIGNDTGLLLRFRVKYERPVGANRTLVLSVEPFYDFRDTDWGGKRGFRQNRLFGGMDWRLGERWAFEAGYMNQYISVDGIENVSNHLAVLNFKARL